MTGTGFFANVGTQTIQLTQGPLLSFLNHILYWRRIACPSTVFFSSTSSATTASGLGGSLGLMFLKME